jgi:glycosyltransferase involved in cell wall biosynthesis
MRSRSSHLYPLLLQLQADRMRVLHILNHLSDRGNGIVNLAVDLAIEQRKAGHITAFASGYGGYEPLLEQYGITFYHLDQTRSLKKLLSASFEFRQILAEFRPDIIHAHMHVGLLIAWPWSRIKRIPLVAHLHNVHDRSAILMGLADRIIAVSRSVSTSMQKQGVRRSKLRVVLNGNLNSARAAQRGAVTPAALRRPAITTVAGMNRRKGIEELILAFNMIAGEFIDSHLYIVGDGPERELFEQLSLKSLFRERIHFEGFQDQPQAYMLSSDIFVLASRRESFGLFLRPVRRAARLSPQMSMVLPRYWKEAKPEFLSHHEIPPHWRTPCACCSVMMSFAETGRREHGEILSFSRLPAWPTK